MSIKQNLDKVAAAVAVATFNGDQGDLGKQISQAAVAAITKGMDSQEWKEYMSLFCDNPNELAQLTVARPTDAPYMPQMRAYIVSNAVCAGDTGTRTGNRVVSDVEPGAGAVAPAGTADPLGLRTQVMNKFGMVFPF